MCRREIQESEAIITKEKDHSASNCVNCHDEEAHIICREKEKGDLTDKRCEIQTKKEL